MLLPIEPDLHDVALALARANSNENVDSWRWVYPGPLMYRVGRFREWYDALSEDSPLRPGNELLVAITDFQRNASDENRHAVEEEIERTHARARGAIREGRLGEHWHGYVEFMSLVREGRRVLGDPEADETGRHIREALALEKRASEAAEAGRLEEAVELYEQVAELPGEIPNHRDLKNLWARTFHWEDAATAYRLTTPPEHIWTILLAYQAGREEEYRAARRSALADAKGLDANALDNLPWVASLLPLEEESRADARALVERLQAKPDPAPWQVASIGRLMYRLGEFDEWYAAQEPRVRNQVEIRMTRAVLAFERDPSEENRLELEQATDGLATSAQRSIVDGVLVPHWPGFLKDLLHYREGRLALGDTETEDADLEFVRLAKARVRGLEISGRAKAAAEAGRLEEAIDLYEEAARIPGMPLDDVGVRDLYARALRWSEAADAYRRSQPTDERLLFALYAAGRDEEYRRVRREAMARVDQVADGSLWNLASAVVLLPLEEDLRSGAREMADRMDDLEVQHAWQPPRIGRLRYRLGEFEEWYSALPEEDRRYGETRMTDALRRFATDASAKNRRAIEQHVASMKNRVWAPQYLTGRGMSETYFPNYVRALSFYREGLEALGNPDAHTAGNDFLKRAKERDEVLVLVQSVRDAEPENTGMRMDELLASPVESSELLSLGEELAQQGHFGPALRAIHRAYELSPGNEVAAVRTLELTAYLGRVEDFRAVRRQRFAAAVDGGLSESLLLRCLLLPLEPGQSETVRELRAARPNAMGGDNLSGWVAFRTGTFSQWWTALGADSPLRGHRHHRLIHALVDRGDESDFAHRELVRWHAAITHQNVMRWVKREDFTTRWPGDFLTNLALAREAFEAIGDDVALGDVDIDRTRTAMARSDEVVQQAATAVEQGELEKAIALYEQAAELAGPTFDWGALGHLYARTRQWEKASAAYLRHSGPLNSYAHLLLYETGQLDEYRSARRLVLENLDRFEGPGLYDIAINISQIPLEAELHAAARRLAEKTAKVETDETWRRARLGRLMLRLGGFEGWYADEDEAGQRVLENRICAAILAFRRDGSAENRMALQQLADSLKTRLEASVTEDGALTYPYWERYVRELSFHRDALETLGVDDAD